MKLLRKHQRKFAPKLLVLLCLAASLPALAYVQPLTFRPEAKIDVAGYSAQAASDPATPIQMAADGRLDTAWWAPVSEGTAWAVLDLGRNWRLGRVNLQFVTEAVGTFRLEYEEAGVWHPLPGGSRVTPQVQVTLKVDPAVATRRIKVTVLAEHGEGKAGGLAEISFWGAEEAPVLNKMRVARVTGEVSGAEQLSYLIDGNTYTAWPILPAESGRWLIAELAIPGTVERIKIFAPELPSFPMAEYRQDGVWYPLPLGDEQVSGGWVSADVLGQTPTSDAVRFKLPQTGENVDLGEVEVWGEETAPGREVIPVPLPAEGVALDETRPRFAAGFTLPAEKKYLRGADLTLDIQGLEDPSALAVEVNGAEVPLAQDTAKHEAMVHIDRNLLTDGINHLTLIWREGSAIRVDAVRLVVDRSNGTLPVQVENKGTEVRLSLGSAQAVDALEFRAEAGAGNQIPPFTLQYRQGNEWKDVPNVGMVAPSGDGWCTVQMGDCPLLTESLRLVSVGGEALPRIEQIRVWGSPVAAGPAAITITSPAAGQVVDKQVTVTGWVDNPAVKVKVNGVTAVLAGHEFTASIRLDPSGAKYARTIQVEAVDANGQISRASVEVFLQKTPPALTLTSPQDGLVTSADAVAVAGNFENNDVELTINGQQVKVTGRTFSTVAAQKEGLNVITLAAKDHFGNQVITTRRVIRDTQAPVLALHQPLPGMYLTASPAVVTGTVSDSTPVQVTVNGVAAQVQGNVFTARGLSLSPGANELTVEAVDSLGHRTVLRATVMVDNQPPVLVVDRPLDNALLTSQPVEAAGSVTDDSGYASVLINGMPVPVENGSFKAPVPLQEGENLLRITTVDLAGNQATTVRRVVLDTTPPEAFTPVVIPEGWTNQPVTITFATTDATSGVDHYEINIDGGQFVQATSPYQLPAVADGSHSITVRAMDKAGWTTDATAQVYVDCTAPVAFQPAAEPSGWTSNTQPVIIFGTTDAASGVAYYEVRVGEEPAVYVRASSPYTLEPQADGERKVYVRAVDLAGNVMESAVSIYVDTTPPQIPAMVEAIPGPDNITLYPTFGDTDVAYLVVKRSPAFSDGGQEKTVPWDGTSYRDGDVTPADYYTYQIKAIDRAGNVGEYSAEVVARAAITQEPVDTTEGVVAKFEGVKLDLPPESLPQDGSTGVVNIYALTQEEADLPPMGDNVQLGYIYNFTLTPDESTIVSEEEPVFTEPVTAFFTYNEADIPAGMTEDNLYVYTYDEGADAWIRVQDQFVDKEKNRIVVSLEHFSMYGIQASTANPLTPDQYRELGVAPYLSYFKDNQENVSPSSGNLSLQAVDLVLQGRNGLDVSISRSYDTINPVSGPGLSYNNDNKRIFPSFGSWEVDLPYIKINDAGHFLRYFGGAIYPIGFPSWRGRLEFGASFEKHDGVHFRLEKIRHKTGDILLFWSIKIGEHWETDGYVLTTPDGRRITFDSKGKPTKIADRTGKNEITISWSGDKLQKITDTLGREITFDYIGTNISAIHSGGKTVKYEYDQGLLVRVIDPMGRVTQYNYNGGRINEIVYPTGGTSHYDFRVDNHTKTVTHHYTETDDEGHRYRVSETETRSYSKTVVSKKWQKASASDAKIYGNTDFSYTYSNFEMEYINGATLTTPLLKTTLSFNDKGLTTSKVMRDRTRNDLLIQKQEYTYTDQKAVKTEKTYRYPKGVETLVYTVSHDYDKWGNQIYVKNTANGLEAWYTYANSDKPQSYAGYQSIPASSVAGYIHNLPTGQFLTNYDPVSGTSQRVQVYYKYDNVGNMVEKGELHNGTWLVSRYEYDGSGYGNVIRETDPEGRVTEYSYSPDYQYAYLTEKKALGLADADGNPLAPVTVSYGYDFATGEKIWERDGRGYLTEFRYDVLGRLLTTALPADGDQGYHPGSNNSQPVRANASTRRIVYDDVNNIETSFNEKGIPTKFYYDGLNHLVRVEQFMAAGDTKPYAVVILEYDDVGNVVRMVDPEGRATGYKYDGLGRPVQTIFPDNTPGNEADNPRTVITYDDGANTATTTNPNGHATKEIRDWMNRTTQVIQDPDGASLVTTLEYDKLGRKVRQTNAKGEVTLYLYDDLGRVTEVKLPNVSVVKPGDGTAASATLTVSYAYDRTGNKVAETSPNGNLLGETARYTTTYVYDALNRPVKTVEPFTQNGTVQSRVTKTYYDEAGNVIRTVDGNGRETRFTYSPRGWLLSVTDPMGNTTTYTYDEVGNKLSTTDPRGVQTPEEGDYTTQFVYDGLNRLVRGILPAQNSPYVEFTYDRMGNKLTERDPNGNITTYNYTPRYWVSSVTDAQGHVSRFEYDAAGNQTAVTDPRGSRTERRYDSLERMYLQIDPEAGQGNRQRSFAYDALGNLTAQTDTNQHTTTYGYNPLQKLSRVTDAMGNVTRYEYDANGNLVRTVNAKGQAVTYRYNELNWLTAETNSQGQTYTYTYDLAGNRLTQTDPMGTVASYQYYANNLLRQVQFQRGSMVEILNYQYDAAGNRTMVQDPSGETRWLYDPLNQVLNMTQTIQGRTYTMDYRYDPAGNMTGIRYPKAAAWLEYQYNSLNQVTNIPGFVESPSGNGITYDTAGNLQRMRFANGVITTYTADPMNRITRIIAEHEYTKQRPLDLAYMYDGEGNVLKRNNNIYAYDALDRLTNAIVPLNNMNTFSENIPGKVGLAPEDLFADASLAFGAQDQTVTLDNNATSVGLDLAQTRERIARLSMVRDPALGDGARVNHDNLALYYSEDNQTYTLVNPDKWALTSTDTGYEITLLNPVNARYLKIHSQYDDRDRSLTPVNQGTFRNTLAGMLPGVQLSMDTEFISYEYDEVGNRTKRITTLKTTETQMYDYYPNSSRLRADGKYAYVYDANGNLIRKGNKYTVNPDGTVSFTTTSGEGVEYWEYAYNLRNQLIKVTKNGQFLASYVYDANGNRVSRASSAYTRDYIFMGLNVAYEEVVSGAAPNGEQKVSYVFSWGKHIAKVQGVIGGAGQVSYYHLDTQGSPMAMTDEAGYQIWEQNYLPYGETLKEEEKGGDSRYKYNGKEQDEDTGLYYYHARWYDSDLGRFLTEDTYAGDVNDPQTLNRYAYVIGNPLRFTDPTGHFWEELGNALAGNGWRSDDEVAEEYSKKQESFEKEYKEKYGQAAWDVLDYTIQKSGLSFGEFMAKNNVNASSVGDYLVGYYASRTKERRDMVGTLGFDYFKQTLKWAGPKGNAKETMAYVADVIKYLAGDNKKQFVEDFFIAFNSYKYPIVQDYIRNKDAITQNINTIIINDPVLGEIFPKGLPFSGFKDIYKDHEDEDGKSDQTHHFAAFLRWAYLEGPYPAMAAAYGIEVGNNFANDEDIRLAMVAISAACYYEPFWDDPGEWIRRNL